MYREAATPACTVFRCIYQGARIAMISLHTHTRRFRENSPNRKPRHFTDVGPLSAATPRLSPSRKTVHLVTRCSSPAPAVLEDDGRGHPAAFDRPNRPGETASAQRHESSTTLSLLATPPTRVGATRCFGGHVWPRWLNKVGEGACWPARFGTAATEYRRDGSLITARNGIPNDVPTALHFSLWAILGSTSAMLKNVAARTRPAKAAKARAVSWSRFK